MLHFHRRRFVLAAVGVGASLALTGWRSAACHASGGLASTFVRTSRALGTQVSITVLGAEQGQAHTALEAAFAAIEQVEGQLSIYRSESQLSRLNRAGWLDDPHPDLVAVLQCAAETSRRSHGAFDITVQPLWERFSLAQKAGKLPTAREIAEATRLVDWRRVQVANDKIRLLGPGTQITLNGIAQGYAADQALAALRRHGIEHALIDTGELAALGDKQPAASAAPASSAPAVAPAIRPEDAGWRVGVQHPREPEAFVALAALKDRCLSTSGDYVTRFTDDRKFHHIFDPATGASPGQLASVSVAAPTAMQADAWSTALFVLGLERSVALLEALPGHDALFVLKDGRTLATSGFPFAKEGVAS